MKATGVVRRIDELGRIVIPKEIRRTLKIKEGTPLEIYSGDDGELLLKKYSPVLEISSVASEVAQSIVEGTNYIVLVTNMEKVVAASGKYKDKYINKPIDSQIDKLIKARQNQIVSLFDINSLLFDINIKNFVISPILTEGDVYGSIIIFGDLSVGETEKLLAKSFSNYLAKQIG